MHKKYKVGQVDKKIYIADYMSEGLGFSSRQAKKLLKSRKIHINGKTAYWDSRLKPGDIIEIDMTEESRHDIKPEKIDLQVIYEDNCLLAVNKPPYMLVHPTPNHPGGTLLNAVAYYLEDRGEKAVLRLLNRLDMNTSGIVVIPKSSAVHRMLDESMKDGGIKKYYTAITEGAICPEKGIIDKPIGKDEENPIKRRVRIDGQAAVTKYETLRSSGDFSLLRLELVTGRTHQIRAHLSHMGCPIAGDTLYGRNSSLIGRQALHASDMELPHPEGKEIIKLHAGLPEDMLRLAQELGLE